MGALSRRKGAAFERAMVQLFREVFGEENCRRGLQARGGDEKPPEDADAQREWARELAVGMLETWMEQAEDPEFETPVVGLVVPHLDYVRGAEVYAGGVEGSPSGPPWVYWNLSG